MAFYFRIALIHGDVLVVNRGVFPVLMGLIHRVNLQAFSIHFFNHFNCFQVYSHAARLCVACACLCSDFIFFSFLAVLLHKQAQSIIATIYKGVCNYDDSKS